MNKQKQMSGWGYKEKRTDTYVGEASWVLLQNIFIVFSWKFIDKNFQPSNRIIFQNITSTSYIILLPNLDAINLLYVKEKT
jgi:hypothetical protein